MSNPSGTRAVAQWKAGEAMDTRKRILYGALGGVAPVVVNLVIVDLVVVFAAVTPIAAVAYAVRVLALVFAGGLVAWLHEEEVKPARLFQFGMLAPALLTGMINGAAVRTQTSTPVAWSLEAVVHAGQEIRTRPEPRERSTLSQIAQGLLGQPAAEADVLVVIAEAETAAQVRKVREALGRELPSSRLLLWRLDAGRYAVSYGEPMPLRRARAVAAELEDDYKQSSHLHASRAAE